jgi:VWFA-related protein
VRLLAVALPLALLAAMLVANPPPARADGELSARLEAIAEGATTATAVVTVLGADGRPLVDLDIEAFEVTDNGESVTISGVALAEDASVGIAVVLAIDTSLSMAPVMGAARDGAGAALGALGEADQAAIIAFSSTVETAHPLTPDIEALAAALDSLEPLGATALYDAVLAATSAAAAAPLDRRVVILLTDGVDEGSLATRDEALSEARDRSVPVYAIGFGANVDQTFLAEMADVSGGRFLLAPDTDALVAAYEELAGLLRSQYVVEFVPGAATEDARRTLTVTVTAGESTATASRSYESSRVAAVPQPVATAVAVAPIAAVQPAPASPPADDAPSEGFPVTVVGAALAAVAVVGALALARRLRGRGSRGAPVPVVRPSRAARAPSARARAALRPLGDAGARPLVVIEGDVLMLNGKASCQSTTRALGFEGEVRLWWRDGKLMLHQRAPYATGDSSQLSWSTLESGDVIEVGSDRFQIEIERAVEVKSR